MKSIEKMFRNFFNDQRITNIRLRNFTEDCLNRMQSADNPAANAAMVTAITPLQAAFKEDLGVISQTLAVRRSKTANAEQVMEAFKVFMRDKHGVIADKLGGFKAAKFLEFYPQGKGEYNGATKTNLPDLVKRVDDIATANAAALGAPLTAELKAFNTQWKAARDAQEAEKGKISGGRAERSASRKALELALLTAVHTVSARFPGDEKQVTALFDFNLLFGSRRRRNGDNNTPDPA